MAGTNRRTLIVGAVCAVALVGAAVYFARGMREALEDPGGKAAIDRRRKPEERGYFDSATSPLFFSAFPSPDAACSERARPALRRAEAAAAAWSPEGAIAPANEALAADPDCVAAAALLVGAHAKLGTHLLVRGRLTERAEAEPGSSAAQLEAAYYAREAGDAAGYRRYLDRATSANRDQPLLDQAWGYYHATVADPRDTRESLRHYQREADRTGSLGSLYSLIFNFVELKDLDEARKACDRYFEAYPGSEQEGPAFRCLEVVLWLGDRAAEPAFLERYWRAKTLVTPCRHGHLAGLLARNTDRLDEAIAEADRAIAGGCPDYGVWPKVLALLRKGDAGAAAALARNGHRRDNHDRKLQAIAVALGGDRQTAVELASGSTSTVVAAGPTGKEENLEELAVLHELLAAGGSLAEVAASYRASHVSSRPDWLGYSGCQYVAHRMYEEGAARIEQALAADPRSKPAWACKVWALEIQDRLDDAAREGEAALALGVDHAVLFNNLAYVYQRRHECKRSVELLEQARVKAPLMQRVYRNLATCLDELGNDAEADAARRFTGESKPSRLGWLAFLGIALGTAGLYLGGKLALIRMLPARFGHLKFP